MECGLVEVLEVQRVDALVVSDASGADDGDLGRARDTRAVVLREDVVGVCDLFLAAGVVWEVVWVEDVCDVIEDLGVDAGLFADDENAVVKKGLFEGCFFGVGE